ncbi:MAG: hypothetical protein MR658_01485 [Campylobacter sp.]|uniref:hypothetical protein n=1 Tax=Campylobacter sp. TaxID=205 RepID=UPI002A86DCE3|nr:hypothetical protein [Campylobacter sp.]MCI6177498.1 hypothetical protein [Campylobacter sp.]MCI7500518.1 hypothetical protein [Campylobacter sp.]MDY4013196.1 hypothetical protein [Campylobacter sp.]
MVTLSELEREFKGCKYYLFNEGEFDHFFVEDVMESDFYCLKGDHEHFFSFFGNYQEDLPPTTLEKIKQDKHMNYFLRFMQKKANLPKDAVITEQILTGFDYATHIKKANETLEKELKKRGFNK